MSTDSLLLEAGRASWLVRASDYLELTKPRIGAMVLVTVGVAAFVANWGPPGAWLLMNTLAGTALVAASASALPGLPSESRASSVNSAGGMSGMVLATIASTLASGTGCSTSR